jgi:hypothetical protein
MSFFRKKKSHDGEDASSNDATGYNPNRDEHLFWYTDEGYIIAQDSVCQYEYVEKSACPSCAGELRVVAHLNRAGQGLSELVTACRECRYTVNFIFDISNEVYQHWWAEQLGPLYLRQYEGAPRTPVSPD